MSSPKDARVQTTSAIWGISVGMLAVCIPLVALTESGLLLPILVLIAAAGSTATVWLSPQSRPQLKGQTLEQLEERIRSLETICSDLDLPLPAADKKHLPKG